ncbi:beta-eliminating lyase-related protein [Nocardioides sp.]|uniref:threonine aldolase family protein n=1 Tax=Nocardioides sp. TaxID=35761 RepID=UPI00260DC1DE|nr:beta-eliminating lyase-related protein [Nocardioides sp.]
MRSRSHAPRRRPGAARLGTLYSVDEIAAIADHVHAKGMRLHLDGARISNAAAALGLTFGEFTTEAGVDIVSFGGTKNGLLYGEAIVVLDPSASDGLLFLRKLNTQLASKMRFVSAQLIALLTDDLYLRSATHANAMAARLRGTLEARDLPGLEFTQATQGNAVFAALPPGVADSLRERFRFYDWNAANREVRWLTAFDTTEEDVDEFSEAIAAALTEPSARPCEGRVSRSSRPTSQLRRFLE